MGHEHSGESVAFFLEGESVPASRFRVEQFQGLLARDGVESVNLYTRPTKYLYYPPIVQNALLKPFWAAGSLGWVVAQRIWQIATAVRPHGTIFLQRDFLYRVPIPFLEALLFAIAKQGGRKRIVFDVDDAIFLAKGGRKSPILKKKIRYIVRRCDLVIVGNQYLADKIAEHSEVLIIPTTIPTDRYVPRLRQQRESDLRVIGWTGLASNLGSLAELEGVLNSLSEAHDFELAILCEEGASPPFRHARFPVRMMGWSPEAEANSLHAFDIGLMPLKDDPWARGKCGFKLLQYMALGIAAVASPVGVNRAIITDGKNGLLAGEPDEWARALDRLLSSADLRQEMGMAGIRTVQDSYSRDVWYPKWKSAVLGTGI